MTNFIQQRGLEQHNRVKIRSITMTDLQEIGIEFQER